MNVCLVSRIGLAAGAVKNSHIPATLRREDHVTQNEEHYGCH